MTWVGPPTRKYLEVGMKDHPGACFWFNLCYAELKISLSQEDRRYFINCWWLSKWILMCSIVRRCRAKMEAFETNSTLRKEKWIRTSILESNSISWYRRRRRIKTSIWEFASCLDSRLQSWAGISQVAPCQGCLKHVWKRKSRTFYEKRKHDCAPCYSSNARRLCNEDEVDWAAMGGGQKTQQKPVLGLSPIDANCKQPFLRTSSWQKETFPSSSPLDVWWWTNSLCEETIS